MMWEVFNPVDGKALFVVPFAFLAKMICHNRPLDWAKRGDGWV